MFNAISDLYLTYCAAWIDWYAARPVTTAIGVIVSGIGALILTIGVVKYVWGLQEKVEKLEAESAK